MVPDGNDSNGLMDCMEIAKSVDYDGRYWAKLFFLITLNGLVIFGNLVVGLAPVVNRRLRNPSHYFIASLAWADFALGIFVIPFAAAAQLRGGVWTYGTYGCQIWQSMSVLLCTGSIYSLIAITFDRYIAVTKPLIYKSWMTPRKCALLVMVVWTGALTVSFPSLFLTWTRNVNSVRSSCQCTPASNGTPFILYSSIGSFYMPMIIILYFYAHIYVAVRKIRLNSNRGIVYVRRRSPTTMMTTMNTDGPDTVLEGSTLAVQGHKRMHSNRFRKKSSNCRQNHPPAEEELSSLLAPTSTPQHDRRPSEGPVLRIHKGRYNDTRSAKVSRVESVTKKRSTCTVMSESPIEVKTTERVSSLTDLYRQKHRKAVGISNIFLQAVGTLSLSASPSPSPSLTWIGPPDSPGPMVKGDETDERKKEPKVPSDAWLRLALPSQLVCAWSHRMLALQRHRRKLSLELRALKTVLMVTGCFFVCWTGYCIVYTRQALPSCHESDWTTSWTIPFGPKDICTEGWIFNLFFWLGYANSGANPIIYGAMNAQFRLTIRRFVGKLAARGAPLIRQTV